MIINATDKHYQYTNIQIIIAAADKVHHQNIMTQHSHQGGNITNTSYDARLSCARCHVQNQCCVTDNQYKNTERLQVVLGSVMQCVISCSVNLIRAELLYSCIIGLVPVRISNEYSRSRIDLGNLCNS